MTDQFLYEPLAHDTRSVSKKRQSGERNFFNSAIRNCNWFSKLQLTGRSLATGNRYLDGRARLPFVTLFAVGDRGYSRLFA